MFLGFIFVLFLLTGLCGLLVIGQQRLNAHRPQGSALRDQILDLLPQTQCAQCGYPGCAPYADALAQGDDHNKCPPGGQTLADQLGTLLNRPQIHLESIPKLVAIIREDDCIGCAKCIPACPVDAIVGAAKMMHTIILKDCTGCELCLPPCPVDCIDLIPRDEIYLP